jgi:hypothetical protein
MTTKRFIDCTGRMMDATPRNLQADAQARGDRAIKLIDEMDSYQCDEGLDAEALATMAREAQIHAELAAAQANRAIDAGGVVAIVQLLPGEKLGLSAALDYAYDDQKNYLEGDPNRDYGDDWYDTRHTKIAQFKGMAAMAELIGETLRAGQFRDLAFELQVEEDADDENLRKENAYYDDMARDERAADALTPEQPKQPPAPTPFADVQLASDDDIPF